MTTQRIATTIANQLGGISKLRAMINAHHFIDADDGLIFHFSGCKKANGILIRLTREDMYDMFFFKTGVRQPVHKEMDIFFDMLTPMIEAYTGLYLTLGNPPQKINVARMRKMLI